MSCHTCVIAYVYCCTCTCRSFHVVNPTTINYEFTWKQKEGPSQIAPVFNCYTPKGQVPGGKKYEVCNYT